ncbi:uncharacterized protein EI90DRAFT_3128575 [Cantharellus anzutake]|uniref:uncharacterized protein n=1 Tax=Cantharellus anzutake TaxID=1750568 RepID=UPI001907F5D7|nr:uncharacterized protein EI90DRAFT_3128575 [Cantharellus anzutake]KAF8325664.1 hypothetical protein EI90DRAFT_3128575 [Cantharellus anzutake]
MQLYHSDPEQKLRIETMTEEEYEKREVLHYAPDANGSVGKYMLPENEVRRAVAKAALTMARPRKRKADLPDSPEGNTVRDSKIESPSPKRVRKKSKATHMRAPAKAKPPRMVPGNNSQVNEARLPQNKAWVIVTDTPFKDRAARLVEAEGHSHACFSKGQAPSHEAREQQSGGQSQTATE